MLRPSSSCSWPVGAAAFCSADEPRRRAPPEELPRFSCREGAVLGSARERFTRFHRDWPGRKEREGCVGLVLTDPFCRLPTHTSERVTRPLPSNKTTVCAVLHCYDMLGRRSRPSAAPLQLALISMPVEVRATPETEMLERSLYTRGQACGRGTASHQLTHCANPCTPPP